MSRSTIHFVTVNGDFLDLELHNSWGFCPFIWDRLCERYQIKCALPWDSWKELWKVVEDKRIVLEPWEWLTLQFTYDHAVVKREQFKDLAAAMRRFAVVYYRPDTVCHLPAIADALEHELGNDELVLACAWGTSVSDDPWRIYNNETEESRPYDFKVDNDHWFIDVRT